MILVDASVWIQFFRGVPDAASEELARLLDDSSAPIAVADVTLYEVLRGFRFERDFLDAQRVMANIESIDVGGRENALQAAHHYRTLRRTGYTNNSVADLLLASYCITHGHALLHADQDFDVFETQRGLKVWRWMMH